jgi:hypothetical protein
VVIFLLVVATVVDGALAALLIGASGFGSATVRKVCTQVRCGGRFHCGGGYLPGGVHSGIYFQQEG